MLGITGTVSDKHFVFLFSLVLFYVILRAAVWLFQCVSSPSFAVRKNDMAVLLSSRQKNTPQLP